MYFAGLVLVSIGECWPVLASVVWHRIGWSIIFIIIFAISPSTVVKRNIDKSVPTVYFVIALQTGPPLQSMAPFGQLLPNNRPVYRDYEQELRKYANFVLNAYIEPNNK